MGGSADYYLLYGSGSDGAAEGYLQLFAKLYQQVYALKSTFSPGIGAISTLVLSKTNPRLGKLKVV